MNNSDLSLVQHILVLEDSANRRIIPLKKAKYSLGRHLTNNIILNSRKASRKHATLIKKKDTKTQQYAYWILDGDLEGNKSQNGIFVNGEKCLIHELKDGDLINFGCNINASYHQLVGIEAIAEIEKKTLIQNAFGTQSLNGQLSESSPNAYPAKTSLILSESHIDDHPSTRTHKSEIENKTLNAESYLDPVTGLPNQNLFLEYFSIALTNAKRNQSYLAIFLIYLETLDNLEQSLESAISSKVLQKAAEIFKHSLRSSDIVARWQGNYFVILISQLKKTEVTEHIQQRIVTNLQQPITINKHSISLDVRTGIAIYPQDGETAQTLIQQAKNNFKIEQRPPKHSRTISPKVSQMMTVAQLTKIENRLYKALQNQEFVLNYHPQINTYTGKIEAMEALLRWQHPQQGLVLPSQFLSFLEQSDLIVPWTEWIVETACLQNILWQNQGLTYVPISINLSTAQFQNPYLPKILEKILKRTGLEPIGLELEITEKTILQNLEMSRQILENLQAIGIYLSIDDFGQGLVSIGYLQDLPFHKLKIAHACVAQLLENPEKTEMITALIALGNTFNLRVVAKGVETQEQLEILHDLQCDAMQGYRFSQPLSADEATHFLSLHQKL